MSSIGGGSGGGRIPAAELGQIQEAQVAEGGIQAAGTEGVNFGKAQVGADGGILVDGVPVDISTPEGAAILMGAVGAEELSQIKAMLHLKEVQGINGPVLVPDDSFSKIDTNALRQTLGPMDTGPGDELDLELAAWFDDQMGTSPYNANTTRAVEANMKSDPNSGLTQAAAAIQAYAEEPNDVTLNEATTALAKAVNFPNSGTINIHEILFVCFKEAIKETNEDKKYFLSKLKMYNDIGEQLSEELKELTQHSRELGIKAAEAKSEDSHKVLTPRPVQVKDFDVTTLGADGKLKHTTRQNEPLDRNGLSNTIKELESVQETVRNKRQMASTAFQNFDQKANQLYNLLSSVMKSMNEMRMGTVRNML